MKLVRFKFYAHGHHRQHTGHIIIQEKDGGWTISSMSISKREVVSRSGTDFLEGGREFLRELKFFVGGWAQAQSEGIENTRLTFNNMGKSRMLRRPGFRPITALQAWERYVRDTQAEIDLVEQDVAATKRALHEAGWCVEPDDSPFPVFVFGVPSWAD